MNQRDALNLAQKAVSQPIGSGTSWTVYSPYYVDRPNGPSTENHYDSYAKASAYRRLTVIGVALAALGYLYDDGALYALDECYGMPARQALARAVRAGKGHERERLRNAQTDAERTQRTVWVAQIEKEERDELRLLGITDAQPDLSDDDLLRELQS